MDAAFSLQPMGGRCPKPQGRLRLVAKAVGLPASQAEAEAAAAAAEEAKVAAKQAKAAAKAAKEEEKADFDAKIQARRGGGM